MAKSITLHPKKGVNPHMSYCPRCGQDAEELLLLGIRDSVRICSSCGTKNYGAGWSDTCGNCYARLQNAEVRKIGDQEKLPASQPCKACQKEIKDHAREVAHGGVYWKCKDCRAEGVIKAGTEFATHVRQTSGVEAPRPVGVEFSKAEGCPACSQKLEQAV